MKLIGLPGKQRGFALALRQGVLVEVRFWPPLLTHSTPLTVECTELGFV